MYLALYFHTIKWRNRPVDFVAELAEKYVVVVHGNSLRDSPVEVTGSFVLIDCQTTNARLRVRVSPGVIRANTESSVLLKTYMIGKSDNYFRWTVGEIVLKEQMLCRKLGDETCPDGAYVLAI